MYVGSISLLTHRVLEADLFHILFYLKPHFYSVKFGYGDNMAVLSFYNGRSTFIYSEPISSENHLMHLFIFFQ